MASASSGGALQTRAGTTTGRKREAAGIRQLHQDPKSSFKQEIYQSCCFIFTSPGTAEQRQYRETSVLPQPSPPCASSGALLAAGVSVLCGASWLPTALAWAGLPALFPFQEKKTKELREGLF